MTKIEALGALLEMAERKVAIYDAVADPKQRKALKYQIQFLTWAANCACGAEVSLRNKDLLKRQRALERRFPL